MTEWTYIFTQATANIAAMLPRPDSLEEKLPDIADNNCSPAKCDIGHDAAGTIYRNIASLSRLPHQHDRPLGNC